LALTSTKAAMMATSNRDRIGSGINLLAAGLGPFVDERMSATVPASQDWVTVLQARSASKEQLSIPVDQDLLCGFRLGGLAGPFDEFSADEGRAGADQCDEVGRVDSPPAVLG